MIDDPAMVVAIFSCIMIVIFYYYGRSCGRRDVEKEAKDQYMAVIKRLSRENELMRKELVELYKTQDTDLNARLKILKILREKKE